jgi:hypothetical protein
MTTKTTTATKTKTASPEQQLAKLKKAMTAEAAATWQQWAVAVADDSGSFPAVAELLAAARELGVDDPVAALRGDAEAIVQARLATAILEACERGMAEALLPHGGSVQALEAKIAQAQARVDELKAVHLQWADGGPRFGPSQDLHRLRIGHPRVWPAYQIAGTAENV